MDAKVIEFRPRRGDSPAPAEVVRAARAGLSREEFAAALGPLVGRAIGPGTVRAWETGVPVPLDVLEACRAGNFRTVQAPGSIAEVPQLVDGTSGDAGPAGDGDAIVIPCRALDGRIIWVSLPRRTFLAGGLGAATLTALGATAGPGTAVLRLRAASAGAAAPSPVEHLRELRRVLVDSDNMLGSGSVLPAVHAQIGVIQQMRAGRRGADHRALVVLQAQYAEFAGWLNQDARDFRAAQFWLDRALEWSNVATDREMSTYIMARKSQLAGDMSAAADAVDLAVAAGSMARRRTRLKATAATYGAHGHALAGERPACLRAIDRAREVAGHLDDDPASPWASWLDRSYIEVQRGRCLAVLGDHAQAAGVFRQAIRDLPPSFRRDRGVYLAREALAYVGAREPEEAASVGMQAVAIAQDTQSGRVIDELARVGAGLARWSRLPAVTEFQDALTSVLPTERIN